MKLGKFQVGKGNVQNEFLLYLSEECPSVSWPSWNKKTSNFYGFWELLVSEEVYILFEEPWVSGGCGDAVEMSRSTFQKREVRYCFLIMCFFSVFLSLETQLHKRS